MQKERRIINIEELKATVDIVEVAQFYTSLQKVSRSGEYAGPCPLCGGTDRFHVKDARFYCRHCYPRGGDVIDLVMLVENLPFPDACHVLSGGSFSLFERSEQWDVPVREPEEIASAWLDKKYQSSARRTIGATRTLLSSAQGEVGQAYLQNRGLTPETWNIYKLGFGQTFHPVRRVQQPAIFIPWFSPDGKQITAIQHRFIEPSLEKHERYSLKSGSSPLLFGLHALTSAETLIIVEGEFNCMALHQEGYQAVSVGSESNRATRNRIELLSDYLPSYDHLLIWFDQPEFGEQFAGELTEQAPFRTRIDIIDVVGADANELLIRGELSQMLGI
ncbi:MAG: toprim domain-containing protein [Caldilineaceae bacterium]|nr:toprim domain-containing protein [Caldilineaceae bacterium]